MWDYLLKTIAFAVVIAVLCAIIGIIIRDSTPRRKTDGGKR